jgi:deazaflavin-dependent oxidoreductase (nitroreductase family)
VNDFNRQIIDEFRANGGKVGGGFESSSILLLHTTGAKSGKERVNPLAYRREGEDLVVFGSKAGAPTNPTGSTTSARTPTPGSRSAPRTFDVRARVAEGDERDRIWADHRREVPAFARVRAEDRSPDPVIVLERV